MPNQYTKALKIAKQLDKQLAKTTKKVVKKIKRKRKQKKALTQRENRRRETLQNQLDTWKAKRPDIYKDILMFGQAKGVIGKKGDITKNLRKQNLVREFQQQYKDMFGTYSGWRKEQIKNYRIAKKKGLTRGARSWEEYYNMNHEFSELVEELFNTFASTIAYEEYQYLMSLDITTAIARLNETLEEGKILPPIEEYESKYGDFESPFD